MNTDLIRIMSNSALRAIARFDTPLSNIPARHRFDAIFARNELNRRDMINAMGDNA